jgi:hypothetical protein
MSKSARRRRIHIQVMVVILKEEIISRADFEGFLNNMAQAYGVKLVRAEDAYHIRAWDQGGRFRILGNIEETFEHLAGEYGTIVKKLAEKRDGQGFKTDADGRPDVALCARITSPSLVDNPSVLAMLNVLFSKYKVGVYFESFPGGIVLYVKDKHGWDIITRIVDPNYIQFKEENRNLLTAAPLEYLGKLRKHLGIE